MSDWPRWFCCGGTHVGGHTDDCPRLVDDPEARPVSAPRKTLVEVLEGIFGVDSPCVPYSPALAHLAARLREADALAQGVDDLKARIVRIRQAVGTADDDPRDTIDVVCALAARYARLREAAQEAVSDIGPCEIVGRWCLSHQTNDCSVGALAALLAEKEGT